MLVFSSIALGIVYTVLIEGLIYRVALGYFSLAVWAKVFFLNIVSFIIAASIALAGYFSFDWQFVMAWGMAHWFLLIIVCEFLPVSILFGELGFRRVFVLLIFSNLFSSMFIAFLILYLPHALMIPGLEMPMYKNHVIDGISRIKGALERYHDVNGSYPAYIYGGDPVSWKNAHENLDPLLKGGYLESYPTNVYHLGRTYFDGRRVPGLRGLFWGEKSDSFRELEKDWVQPVNEDPRFGFRGTRMGNILSVPYIHSSSMYYDYHVYRGSPEEFFLPGAFLYKAFDTDLDGRFDSYILAGFGSEQEQGEDIYNQSEDKVTRTVNGQLVVGNKDRKKDGVVIVETGGFKKWRE